MNKNVEIGQTISITTAQGTETGTRISAAPYTPFAGEYDGRILVQWADGRLDFTEVESLD